MKENKKIKKKSKSKELTPMMKQYAGIKKKNPNHILFYRMGDFFELFFDDAKVASKVLNLTLTSRGKHLENSIPLAGFPHMHLETYLSKMVKAGYKVAVCDQIEDPKFSTGVVKRDIVEIVTAGTAISESIIDTDTINYLASITSSSINLKDDKENINTIPRYKYALSVSDISSGEFLATEFNNEYELIDTLLLFRPSEILIPSEMIAFFEKINQFKKVKAISQLTLIDDWKFDYNFASDQLLDYYKINSIKTLGFEKNPLAISCAGVLLYYVKENLRSNFDHISRLKKYISHNFVSIDESTRRNLELLEPISFSGDKDATLYSVLNKTKTGMGARLLKKWIVFPLKSLPEIGKRFEFVSFLIDNKKTNLELSKYLDSISDFERFISKISLLRILPFELVKLKQALITIPLIKELLQNSDIDSITSKTNKFENLAGCIELIKQSIDDSVSAGRNESGFIKKGYNKDLDELYEILSSGKEWIISLQNKVRTELEIPTLKVGYNRVFGYYFEVTNKYSDKIPNSYIKKQTLVNNERFINEELKVLEDKILSADEKIKILEKSLLLGIREKINKYVKKIKNNAKIIAEIDCLNSFSIVSYEQRYIRPELTSNFDSIEIKNGRHPVVEKLLPPGEDFIPNNLSMDKDEKILLVTGPNMSGKSTYLRQSAIIVLMAQIGCFVPADFARIGIVDKIFTRVGANDNLAGGESTFLVEMNESANILNNATNKSFIIFDEVGRGTSTFDGLSLAWSIVEYIHNNKQLNSRTLFATHYHELTEIERVCERVKNYSVSVREYKNEVIFMRKIVKGSADNSYGIYVAKLAGLPKTIIERANEILLNLEKNELTPDDKPKLAAGNREDGLDFMQLSLFSEENDAVREKIKKIDINNFTPLKALELLNELKSMIEK